MPVVLEEFGSKLDVRNAQYKLAYDNCLVSAKRGGSCAGVMFWDLAHKVICLSDSCGCISNILAQYLKCLQLRSFVLCHPRMMP